MISEGAGGIIRFDLKYQGRNSTTNKVTRAFYTFAKEISKIPETLRFLPRPPVPDESHARRADRKSVV